MLQFGMPTLIENRTLQENVALCSALGLQFIELNMNYPEYQLTALEQTDAFLEAAGRAGIVGQGDSSYVLLSGITLFRIVLA